MRGALRELPRQASCKAAGVMRTWTREQQNAAWRKWYVKNASRKIAWGERRRRELRVWWEGLKATKRCERCGESAPECLHFHHRDQAKKISSSPMQLRA